MADSKKCVAWVEKYLKDCVSGVPDYVSLSLGLLSMVTWALAEVPQIVTNFRNQSTEGVSLGFLITWVIGHILSVGGCFLEPTTLPTQFYTAILFTMATFVLLGQVIYYDHICTATRRSGSMQDRHPYWSQLEDLESETEPQNLDNSGLMIVRENDCRSLGTFASSMPLPRASPIGGGLAKYLPNSQLSSLPISFPRISSESDTRGSNHVFFLASTILSMGGLSFTDCNTLPNSENFEGKLISVMHGNGNESSRVGFYLGWLMAALYMGGQLPQIWLNFQRGSLQGIHPLMFILAIVGNATYLASVIVRTPRWEKLWFNTPWLLDAAACVILDLFILGQYVYYESRRRITELTLISDDEDEGYYEPL